MDDMSQRILAEAEGKTRVDAAAALGLRFFDIRNIKDGNRPSLAMLVRLVRLGGYAPNYLIFGTGPKKLRSNVSVRGVQIRSIQVRMRWQLKNRLADELAQESGLPIQSIYQYRVLHRRPGLHILLGLVITGVAPKRLILGS